MTEDVFTVGIWHVKEGKEDEFVVAWKALGDLFYSLPQPPGTGTLVRSVDDPQLFVSFGPWPSLDAIQAMRSHSGTPDAIGRLRELCDEATPGTYRQVVRLPE